MLGATVIAVIVIIFATMASQASKRNKLKALEIRQAAGEDVSKELKRASNGSPIVKFGCASIFAFFIFVTFISPKLSSNNVSEALPAQQKDEAPKELTKPKPTTKT